MAIEPVSSTTNINPVTASKSVAAPETAEQDYGDVAAVYEKSEPAPKSKLYSRDTVNRMNAELDAKYSGLKSLVEKLLSGQSAKSGQSSGLSFEQIQQQYSGNLKEFYSNLQVDSDTKLQAQKDIAADGYWGVNQTSQRIVEFAKNLSGGDKAKIEELRKAIEKGFDNAERAWGGSLPDICMQTKEAVMKGIDDWANEQ